MSRHRTEATEVLVMGTQKGRKAVRRDTKGRPQVGASEESGPSPWRLSTLAVSPREEGAESRQSVRVVIWRSDRCEQSEGWHGEESGDTLPSSTSCATRKPSQSPGSDVGLDPGWISVVLVVVLKNVGSVVLAKNCVTRTGDAVVVVAIVIVIVIVATRMRVRKRSMVEDGVGGVGGVWRGG